MPIQEQLRDVLIIIADLTKNDANADTYDFVIYERLNHIAQEKVDKYLNESIFSWINCRKNTTKNFRCRL